MIRAPACVRALALAWAVLLSPLASALPDDAAVGAMLADRIAQRRAVGLAAVLFDPRGVRIVTSGALREGGPPVGADTEFEIGSLTKTYTALLLAEEALRGAVGLDDPVTKYLPGNASGLTRNGKTVTLIQLASHTSGLPRLPGNLSPADLRDPYADYDGAKLMAFLSGDVLERAPGEEYEYSNLGAGLLGFALAERDGGYENVLRERVLAPLQLADTTITLSASQRERFATGHDRQLKAVPPRRLAALAGAGGLRSTPSDMGKYLRAAVDPEKAPLGAAMSLAQRPRADGPDPATQVGLAWHILSRNGHTVIWHNGQTAGFASMMAFDPAAREGVVVLANTGVSVDDLALHMLDASIPLSSPPKARNAIRIDTAIAETIAGRYELAPGSVIAVRRDGDRVFARVSAQGEAEIFAESDYEYFSRVIDAQLSFLHAGDGRVSGLVLHLGGHNLTARRID